jgi:hypothetical protein
MLLHLGNDQMVLSEDIEFILDYDECKKNVDSKLFLKKAKQTAELIYISKKNISSIIFTKKNDQILLYFSPINSSTLLKRADDNFNDFSLVKGNIDLSELKWNF